MDIIIEPVKKEILRNLFVLFSPLHFFVCEKLLAQFPYRKQKTVSYSRNVMRHAQDRYAC